YNLCDGASTATFFSALTKKPPAMKLHAAAFLVIFWLAIFTVHTVKGSVGSQRMRKFSCIRLSTQQLSIRNLVSYEKQRVPIDAVMFLDSKGIKICVSSKEKWVPEAMKKIDQKHTTKRK
ncbi:LOW QUALITY PROTEIN: C-C motif chemokine 7-like, partial [Rhynochetos jubatus]